MGTDRLGRDVLSRVMVGLARRPHRRAAGGAPRRHRRARLLGLVMGYYRGTRGRRPEPPRRGVPRPAGRPGRAADAGRARVVAARRRLRRRASCSRRSWRGRSARPSCSERQLDYVTAAKLRGESGPFILSREIFPNVLGPTVVELTVRFGYAIFTVATLSFLGVGHPAAVAGLGPDRERGVHEHDLRASGGPRSSRRWPSRARSSRST